ncbi:MAG: C-GCAxxG-C-C family protein [Planctomycetes bacterium]|nr:C-GCAxxG-C-C family protein [Planctomycetota bacterium]
MSTHSDHSVKLFNEGCNCCQAVVAARAGEFGVPDETALAMGAAFGGGMRRGEVCGAVVGGLMLLGLKYGARSPADQEQKAVANAKPSSSWTPSRPGTDRTSAANS